MKKLKIILAIWDGTVVTYGVRGPLITMILSYFVFHPSLHSALLLGCSILSTLFAYRSLYLWKDEKNNQEILHFITDYPNYQFKKIALDDLVSKYGNLDDIKGELFQGTGDNLGNAYLAQLKDRTITTRFNGYKSFPRFFLPNIVILPPEAAKELKIFSLFKLFHELGHLGKGHRDMCIAGYRTTMCLLQIALTGILVTFPWYLWFPLVGFSLIWAMYSYILTISMNHKIGIAEKIADSFAIYHLREHPEFSILKKAMDESKTKMAQSFRESSPYYEKWFGDIYDIQNENWVKFLSKHGSGKRMRHLMDYGVSNKSVNYNSMINELDQSYKPGRFLILILVICGAAGQRQLNNFLFAGLLGLILLLPFLSSIILYIKIFRTEVQITNSFTDDKLSS